MFKLTNVCKLSYLIVCFYVLRYITLSVSIHVRLRNILILFDKISIATFTTKSNFVFLQTMPEFTCNCQTLNDWRILYKKFLVQQNLFSLLLIFDEENFERDLVQKLLLSFMPMSDNIFIVRLLQLMAIIRYYMNKSIKIVHDTKCQIFLINSKIFYLHSKINHVKAMPAREVCMTCI